MARSEPTDVEHIDHLTPGETRALAEELREYGYPNLAAWLDECADAEEATA